MTLAHADGYGRRFYPRQGPVEYRIVPRHTYARGEAGEWIITAEAFAAVTDDWYRRGEEKDFDTVEHFRAPTKGEVEAWIAAKA